MTDIAIYQNSFPHHNHKMAMFNFLINRLNNTPMNKVDHDLELKKIDQIATANGCPNDLASKIIKRKEKKTSKKKRHSLVVISLAKILSSVSGEHYGI